MNETKISVLDKGFVELQDKMGDDLAIVNAARVSYLGESKGEKQDYRLLYYLMRNAHTSPFEQVEFKFKIKAPLIVLWQLVRHRTASFNMQSGRYTEFGGDDFYIPSKWRLQSKDNKQGSDGVLENDTKEYALLTNDLSDLQLKGYPHEIENALKECVNLGYSIYQTLLKHNIAKEQARLFLPAFSLYYSCIWKIDAHNLMHFLKLRMSDHAQYEIREYANAIFQIFEDKLPVTAKAFNMYIKNTPKLGTIKKGKLLEQLNDATVEELEYISSNLGKLKKE